MKISVNRFRLICFLLLFTASVVWASFYGGVLPFSVLFILILYPLYIIFIAAYSHFAFRISQALSEVKIKKHSIYPYTIHIENGGILPLVKLGVSMESPLIKIYESNLPGELSLEPFEKESYTVYLSCLYAGTYEIGIRQFTVEDPFSLVTVAFKTYDPFRVIVRPEITDMADRIMASKTFIVGNITDPDHMDNTLGADERRYLPSDDKRGIDWRRYARSDELYVRLYEEAGLGGIHIFIDSLDGPFDLEGFKRRDILLEFTVSALQWFINRQTLVYLHYVSRNKVCA
ncbi:MAG: DUF58 domain-containing protein, partial [Lachnospiraceae bacterium]|nr:DUF58 domain-containing protein [Lachnospiraceae bacterium]